MLTSAELTGLWEKQLKEIENGNYHAGVFIKNMKQMIDDLVYEVRIEKRHIKISEATVAAAPKPTKEKKTATVQGKPCPKCKQGELLKGKTAYGCSAYKTGCKMVLPFVFKEKKISTKQYLRLLDKGCTVNLKGFKTENGTKEGLLRFNDDFELVLEEKKTAVKVKQDEVPNPMPCPLCSQGTVLKGKTAYGCSNYKTGCSFKYPFAVLREKAAGTPLTKELVFKLLNKK